MMNTEIRQRLDRLLKLQDWNGALEAEPAVFKSRLTAELTGLGPLEAPLNDDRVSEVLANSPTDIFFEKDGNLFKLDDEFYSEATWQAAVERLSQSCQTYLCREKPYVESNIGKWRVSLVFGEIAKGHTLISIRKQPQKIRSLQNLMEAQFINSKQHIILQNIYSEKTGFLVVGGTSSGKTTLIQALLDLALPNERIVLLEDTREIKLPNACSVSLLTRQDPARQVPDVLLEDLLKRALRLRPDRLVVGEIRGAEATALLTAMSTGHEGSFGSLHARTASEALLRLEMLTQLGAPQWSLQSIRKLISLSVKYVLVLEKCGAFRRLNGIFEIKSLEQNGLTLEEISGDESC